ncbi:MAG: RidA family protein [Bryobacterales bacterium]|nr:RidA family protein [Bryobacterales bacterium]
MKKSRRNLLGAALGAAAMTPAASAQAPEKKVYFRGPRPTTTPLFPSAAILGNMVYVSGHGVNDVAGAKAQTAKVLDEIEQILQGVGSSMRKVLKCTVFLSDIRDFPEMNEAYRGRFGPEPPARTTVEVANIPLKDCLVEIECIAYI